MCIQHSYVYTECRAFHVFESLELCNKERKQKDRVENGERSFSDVFFHASHTTKKSEKKEREGRCPKCEKVDQKA